MGPILCLNAGSSSLKFALYEGQQRLIAGAAEKIGASSGLLWAEGESGSCIHEERPIKDGAAALSWALETAEKVSPVCAAGHRIVHGGAAHTTPQVVNDGLLRSLRSLIPFAPLHLPFELRIVEALRRAMPHTPQIVCFDTAFHCRMPQLAKRYALPRSLMDEGVRRYGFHGLSYEYVGATVTEASRGRVVIAHLGNGASMAALKEGKPQETTMGFTPAGGLMMGTRPGDLDPGVLLYLLEQKGLNAEQIRTLVYKQSGLLGVSGLTRDMKTLLERASVDQAAAEAVELFCYQAAKSVGALAAVLGGLDCLIFTGGIGERAAPVRDKICSRLGFLGIEIDEQSNKESERVISKPSKACRVLVVKTDEDAMIAEHTAKVITSRSLG